MSSATRKTYEVALKEAEAELAAHGQRGEALRNTVDSLRTLLAFGAPEPPPKPRRPRRPAPARKLRKPRRSAGAGHPEVAPGFFGGMGPTAAYRKFQAAYGDSYSVPQIRDALVAGGVNSKSTTSLLTGLHSVRRRDRIKAEAEESGA